MYIHQNHQRCNVMTLKPDAIDAVFWNTAE